MGSVEGWRADFNNDSQFRQRVTDRVHRQIREQAARGLSKYGSDFQGDPLQHAFEEAIGLATYLATEIERRENEPAHRCIMHSRLDCTHSDCRKNGGGDSDGAQ